MGRFDPDGRFVATDGTPIRVVHGNGQRLRNASFVIIGLVASVRDLNESIWRTFTLQTLRLRPSAAPA